MGTVREGANERHLLQTTRILPLCLLPPPPPPPPLTFTLSKMISAWSPTCPNTSRARIMRTPGVSLGMISIVCCPCRGPSVAVRPRKMNTLHSGRMLPLMYHLWPLTR